jgi:SPOR domain
MADRYQDRPFPTDADHDRGANPYVRGESEPLAELAQLIGQTDPFAEASLPLQSRANVRPQYAPAEEEASAPAGLPPWRLRARQEAPPLQPEQPIPVDPLLRYAAPPAAASEQNHHEPQQDTDEQPADPSRYDDALYGPIKSVEQENAHDPTYPADPYAYQRDYEEEPVPRKRSGWVVTVAAVLALAVVGTGAAFGYRTYVGSPRSGEPPIITADNSPIKVVPAQSDGGASKIPDRMPPGGGGEKLVSREEVPVDINSRSGASLVEFPPLNQNSSPPPAASVSPTGPALATAANGRMPNNEPRRIKALTGKGDATENGGIPAGAAAPAKPDPAARSASAPTAPAQRNPSAANAGANAPLTLSPQSAPASDPAPPTRLAATNAVQTAPSAGGGYLVQVSSEKKEADAQVSYRALQNKFPAALGSRPPVIKRADLGDKGVYYRTMVGPFGSTEEAAEFCGNLKSAGGQCVVQKN